MQAQRQPQQLPPVVLCVTGKGPLRQHFQARMAASDLRRVACRTLWLTAGDYPRLLGAADLGVCLHTSSSGLDLPMKVSKCWKARRACMGPVLQLSRGVKWGSLVRRVSLTVLEGLPTTLKRIGWDSIGLDSIGCAVPACSFAGS